MERRDDGQPDFCLPRAADDDFRATGHELVANAGIGAEVATVVAVHVDGLDRFT